MTASPPPAPPGGIDPAYLAARGVSAVAVEDGRLVVTMADPDDAETIAAIAFAARRPAVARAAPVARPLPPPDPMPAPPPDHGTSLAGGIFAAIARDRHAEWVAADADAAPALRFALERGIALRRALAVPALAGIVAAITVGGWGLLLLPVLWPLRRALAGLDAARRVEGDPAGAAVARTRALLGVADAEARMATLAVLGLALLLVVRLG